MNFDTQAIDGLKIALKTLETADSTEEENLQAIVILGLCKCLVVNSYKRQVTDPKLKISSHVQPPIYSGQKYYKPTLGTAKELCEERTWSFTKTDIHNLRNSLVFLNKEDAEADELAFRNSF